MSSRTSSAKRSRSPPGRKSRSRSTKKNSTSLGTKLRTPSNSDQQEESPPRYRSSSSSSESSSETSSGSSPSRERISKSTVCNLVFPVARVKSMLKVNLKKQYVFICKINIHTISVIAFWHKNRH